MFVVLFVGVCLLFVVVFCGLIDVCNGLLVVCGLVLLCNNVVRFVLFVVRCHDCLL